jgi:hypothetical protein
MKWMQDLACQSANRFNVELPLALSSGWFAKVALRIGVPSFIPL